MFSVIRVPVSGCIAGGLAMIASYRDHKPVHLFQQSPHRALTFGNVETISRGMTSFLQDFRSALRSIRKTRAVTFAVLVSLSLGIGSTASVFSLVNSFLLRPNPRWVVLFVPRQIRHRDWALSPPSLGALWNWRPYAAA